MFEKQTHTPSFDVVHVQVPGQSAKDDLLVAETTAAHHARVDLPDQHTQSFCCYRHQQCQVTWVKLQFSSVHVLFNQPGKPHRATVNLHVNLHCTHFWQGTYTNVQCSPVCVPTACLSWEVEHVTHDSTLMTELLRELLTIQTSSQNKHVRTPCTMSCTCTCADMVN